MARQAVQADVLVLGEHPSAYLAAALLRHKSKLAVLHSTIPGQAWPDRLVRINSELFDLHELLTPLRRKLDLAATYGVKFLSEDASTASEHRARSAMVYISSYKQIRAAVTKLAEQQDVELLNPKTLQIQHVDETGADVQLGNTSIRVKALVVACELPPDQKRMLAIPDGWEQEVFHRYAWVKLKSFKSLSVENKPTLPVCLDLFNQRASGWLLMNDTQAQVSVVASVAQLRELPVEQVMQRWVKVLQQHGVLKEGEPVRLDEMEWLDLPLAGGLAQEGVGNRTLLVGPAGGFFSATAEDIYPTCWSALHAADVLKKSLKEPHLQDALGAYRARWRTTLGDYLRGPQQNLRFLLPLVYRNQVMTTRLAEAILLGRSVVR
jgi:flavin-dependent dehydrogenase